MNETSDTTRIFIPLAFKRQNGRPRIMAPDLEPHFQARVQDPHILRALGRAWSWRRKFESGEVATIHDIAKAEGVTDRFVSRMMRLAYLSPDVLEGLLLWRDQPSTTIVQMIEATYLPWREQMGSVFQGGGAADRVRMSSSLLPASKRLTQADGVRPLLTHSGRREGRSSRNLVCRDEVVIAAVRGPLNLAREVLQRERSAPQKDATTSTKCRYRNRRCLKL